MQFRNLSERVKWARNQPRQAGGQLAEPFRSQLMQMVQAFERLVPPEERDLEDQLLEYLPCPQISTLP